MELSGLEEKKRQGKPRKGRQGGEGCLERIDIGCHCCPKARVNKTKASILLKGSVQQVFQRANLVTACGQIYSSWDGLLRSRISSAILSLQKT